MNLTIEQSKIINQYERSEITIGKAAQILGMRRYEFECFLSDNEIPISNLTIDEIEKDVLKL